MTPQLEEAERLLRLARRDETAMQVLLDAPEVPKALPTCADSRLMQWSTATTTKHLNS